MHFKGILAGHTLILQHVVLGKKITFIISAHSDFAESQLPLGKQGGV